MPTYEYKCKNCSHLFEQFQSMKDAPLRKCPECGRNALERLIGTGAAVLFKGSGFYQTDYRSESYKAARKAETSEPAAKGGEGGASKGNAPKPAETSGAKAESPKPTEGKPKPSAPAAPRKKSKPSD